MGEVEDSALEEEGLDRDQGGGEEASAADEEEFGIRRPTKVRDPREPSRAEVSRNTDSRAACR